MIVAVMYMVKAISKEKPQNKIHFQTYSGFEPVTSVIPVNHSYQLSYRAVGNRP